MEKKKHNLKISIITVCYNSEKTIRSTYDHIIMAQQTKELFKDERGLEEDTFQSVVG